MMRIFFATDLHGSEVCFRKFLNAGPVYKANVVIMGGDCTGKMIIPLVSSENGSYTREWGGKTQVIDSTEKLEELETHLRNQGLYPVRVSPGEMERLNTDPERVSALFNTVMTETLGRWMVLAEERLGKSEVQIIITPGNDDQFEVDEVLQRSSVVQAPDGAVVIVGGRHEMLNLSWSNPTPWDTPRECSEEELRDKIDVLARQISDMRNAIFNIHVPPFGSGLDLAPELEDGTKVKRGGTMHKSVGSTAVRDAILEYQPLLSLHGHIHESRGMQKLGQTTSINPGSAYSDGALQGVLVDLEDHKVKRYVPVTG
jgi:Icc-related predicted phosphoesterase